MTNQPALNQERDLGQVISDSFSILGETWRPLCVIVTPAVLVSILLSLLSVLVSDVAVLGDVFWLLTWPFDLLAYQLVIAAGVALLVARDQGRVIQAGDALDAAQDRFGHLVVAAFKATVIPMLLIATILGIPWGFKRLIMWAFVPQTIMVDGKSADGSLALSAELVRGRWWITFGRLLASFLVLGIPAFAVSWLLGQAIPGTLGLIIPTAVSSFISEPFGIIASTLLYFDLKVRKAAESVSVSEDMMGAS